MDRLSSPAAEMLGELTQLPSSHAPTMGRLEKVRYSHVDMIDFIIANPWASQNEIAARYGYTPGWVSNVLASDAFQSQMAARREEIVDPAMKATLEERFRAMAIRSLDRLMERLEKPAVSDQVILRAVELGAKAVGVGGNAPPPAPNQDHLAVLADRLLKLQSQVRTNFREGAIDGQAIQIPDAG